jgi:hypothetical protein
MVTIAGLPTWLEQVIGTNRNATAVAQQIGQHAEFVKIVQEAIDWAAQHPAHGVSESRIIAEDIAVRLFHLFTEFKTMHDQG